MHKMRICTVNHWVQLQNDEVVHVNEPAMAVKHAVDLHHTFELKKQKGQPVGHAIWSLEPGVEPQTYLSIHEHT